MESQRFWLPVVMVAASFVGGALVNVGFAGKEPPIPQVIQARRFEVLDQAGKVRAVLSHENDAPALQLLDEKGQSLATLGGTREGSCGLALRDQSKTGAHLSTTLLPGHLTLHDAGQKPAVSLDARLGFTLVAYDAANLANAWLTFDVFDGVPSVELRNGGTSVASLSVDAAGVAGLLLRDEREGGISLVSRRGGASGLEIAQGNVERGKARVRLATESDGRATLTLHDKSGRQRAGITVTADGSPRLTLFDGQGKSRGMWSVDPDGALLFLADKDETPRFGLGVLADGTPQLSLLDNNGRERAKLGVAVSETDAKGSGAKPAEAAIVLFDEAGKVVFKAP
ncbi:MAG: hypothetical protein ACYSUQ_05095 [Planctomycetota bacterium]